MKIQDHGGYRLSTLRLAILALALSTVSCVAAKRSTSYLSSLDYQARETLSQSLFREDVSLISNEEIERVLSSKVELPRDARLILLQLGSDADILVLPQADSEEVDALSRLFEQVSASNRLTSVALLPSLLVPRNLSVAKLRESAARFQGDLLFIYRVPCQQFRRNRFLGQDEAKAYCLAEGVLLDVRTGIIPFSGVGTSVFEAVENPEDLNSYETLRRSQAEAVVLALDELAAELTSFLDAAP